MSTLHLQQSPAQEDGRFPITIVWREGDGDETHVKGLSAAGLDDATAGELRWYFEDYLDQLYDPPTHERARRLEARMTALGEELFRDLFEMSVDARDLWAQLRNRLAETRVEISAGVRETATIPWELLSDPRGQRPLALTAREFVRVPSKGALKPHRVRLAEGEPLRILLAICRPDRGADVPFRSVASRLFKSLSDGGGGRVELTVLRPPTFAGLGKALEAAQAAGRPFHLIHFDGHGTYGEPAAANGTSPGAHRFESGGPRGYLLFEDPTADDRRWLVDGRELGALLNRHGVAALVLNACQSADGGSGGDDAKAGPDQPKPAAPADQVRAQGSLAQEAIDAGVGAVVAMRYVVYVETAAHYVGRFYELVAGGRSFGAAATGARATLEAEREREIGGERVAFRDWPVPVAFESNPLPLLSRPAKDQPGAPLFRLSGRARGVNDRLPPSPEIGFIGRDAVLLDLDRAFDDHTLVLLHAYAGSGKTTTAVEFARWYRDTQGIAGPVWFTSFQDHTPLARVLDIIEETYGKTLEANGINWLSLEKTAEKAQVALEVLAQVPVLWIWDNVEEVAGFPAGSASKWTATEQAELRDFLARLRGTKARVLLTSRRDERGWLGELPVPVRPGDMPMRERLLMAAELAKHHGADPGVVPELLPLLEWSQGNPMTLGVVVGQALRDGTVTAPRVAAYLARLRAGEAAFEDDAGQGRSKSLSASLAYGFEAAFSAAERPLLALLHLFQELVDADVLVWMGHDKNPGRATPYAGLDRSTWTALLDRAAAIGLLTAHGGGLYSIHPALPWFLKTGFEAAFGPATAAPPPLRAWVEAMGALANYWANRIATQGDHSALAPLRAQEANLRHARALAIRHGWIGPALSAMQGLRDIHEGAGRWAAWAGLVAEIVPLAEDPATGEPRPGLERHWSLTIEYRVGLARHSHDSAAVLALQQRRVAVKRRSTASVLATDPAGLDDAQRHQLRNLGVALEHLGIAQCEAGNPAGLAVLTEAKEIYVQIGLIREAAIAAFNLGHAYKNVAAVRDLDAAEAAYREALALHTDDDRAGHAKCHNQLGLVAWSRFQDAQRNGAGRDILDGHLQAAVDAHQTALALLPAGAHDDRAVAHNALGVIFKTVGAFEDAAGHYHQSLRHHDVHGNPYGAAETRWNLANLYRTAGRFDLARDYARAALAGFERFEGRAAAEVERTRRLLALIEARDRTP